MCPRVLVTEPVVDAAIERLKKSFEVDVGTRGYYDEENHLLEDIPNYDAVLALLSNPFTEEVLNAGSSLIIVANMAAGYDNIDVPAGRRTNIMVTNTPGVLTDATADLTWALLLATARRLNEAEPYLRAGKFDGWDPLGFMGTELRDQTLGILGMGRIGSAVAERALGFGMNILYHNRTRVDAAKEKRLNASYAESVLELAEQSDILSLNCPLNDGTYYAVNREVLKALGSEGILINTARGAVVDEQALADALHTETIGGAGLDVFEEEPEINPDLFDAPHCLMTPHIGSATRRTREKMGMLAVESIEAALGGKKAEDIPHLIT